MCQKFASAETIMSAAYTLWTYDVMITYDSNQKLRLLNLKILQSKFADKLIL